MVRAPEEKGLPCMLSCAQRLVGVERHTMMESRRTHGALHGCPLAASFNTLRVLLHEHTGFFFQIKN